VGWKLRFEVRMLIIHKLRKQKAQFKHPILNRHVEWLKKPTALLQWKSEIHQKTHWQDLGLPPLWNPRLY
jgi:hypothetical protein